MGQIVWIIDDDLVSQFATEYSIQQANYNSTIRSFDEAAKSLEKLKECILNSKEIPDVILLDLVMPEMNGWEFLDQIQKLVGWNDSINVYIISSFSNSKDRTLAQNHPLIKGYFNKPLSKISVEQIFQSLQVDE